MLNEENQEVEAQTVSESNQKAENQNAEEQCTATNSECADEQCENEQNTEVPQSQEEILTAKVASLEAEVADLKEQLLRRAADFDNYRKRMIKEKQDAYDYANANLLGDLLDSLDNFDRTIEAANSATDPKVIADGVKMINKSLVKMLEDKYNLVCYGKEGEEFNPEEHEAIGRMEDEKAKKETLKQVYLKGYKLKDKIIRNAKVMVSVPKA
ncbi:MAG: nucleotide exchange factor GrpE [Treponema sp.]|nr:nucleotide exchange factor GrpE [Treponema sp.]